MGEGFILPVLVTFDLLYSRKKNNLKKEWMREGMKKGGTVQIEVLRVDSICLRERHCGGFYYFIYFSHIFSKLFLVNMYDIYKLNKSSKYLLLKPLAKQL